MRLAAVGALAHVLHARPEQPVAVDRTLERRGVDVAGGGDEAHLELAGAAALADHEVAQEAGLRAPVPRLEPLLATPCEHLVARRVAALGLQQAVVDRDDLVELPGRVEAADELAAGTGP